MMMIIIMTILNIRVRCDDHHDECHYHLYTMQPKVVSELSFPWFLGGILYRKVVSVFCFSDQKCRFWHSAIRYVRPPSIYLNSYLFWTRWSSRLRDGKTLVWLIFRLKNPFRPDVDKMAVSGKGSVAESTRGRVFLTKPLLFSVLRVVVCARNMEEVLKEI